MHSAVVCQVSQIGTIFSDIFVTKKPFGQCFSKKRPIFRVFLKFRMTVRL